jgi:hypothetical protein
MAKGLAIEFIWVNRNNEWQIPEDLELPEDDYLISEFLNDVTGSWNDAEDLEMTLTEAITPPAFLANPVFDSTFLDSICNGSFEGEHKAFLSREWVELGKTLNSKKINPDVISVPNGMTPWEWYALTEEERRSQMGLGESESPRADGVLYSEYNSFYFDTYRFGTLYFKLTEAMKIKEIIANPEFITYSQEITERGLGFISHKKCGDDCDYQSCSQILTFPASISLE